MGTLVGEDDGAAVGDAVGSAVGTAVGPCVGREVGETDGAAVGAAVGACVGDLVETMQQNSEQLSPAGHSASIFDASKVVPVSQCVALVPLPGAVTVVSSGVGAEQTDRHHHSVHDSPFPRVGALWPS